MTTSAPPTRKQRTHLRILDAAARALRRKGIGGVGVAEVMQEAGLTHGGFYAHFASRDAMLAEALEHAGRDSAVAINQAVAAGQARGASVFRAFVDSYLADSLLAAPDAGCPVAALASDFARFGHAGNAGNAENARSGGSGGSGRGLDAIGASGDKPVGDLHSAARQRIARLLSAITNSLPAGAPAGAAGVIASTLVGTLQLGRTLGNNAQGKALLAASRQALLAQYDLPAPAGHRS